MPYACQDAYKTRHSLCCELAAQFTERSTQVHWVAVKRILRYLDGRKDVAFMYRGTNTDNHFKVFCNADFAGDQNDCKSRT
jgi:hypothetical protein